MWRQNYSLLFLSITLLIFFFLLVSYSISSILFLNELNEFAGSFVILLAFLIRNRFAWLKKAAKQVADIIRLNPFVLHTFESYSDGRLLDLCSWLGFSWEVTKGEQRPFVVDWNLYIYIMMIGNTKIEWIQDNWFIAVSLKKTIFYESINFFNDAAKLLNYFLQDSRF